VPVALSGVGCLELVVQLPAASVVHHSVRRSRYKPIRKVLEAMPKLLGEVVRGGGLSSECVAVLCVRVVVVVVGLSRVKRLCVGVLVGVGGS
jgi:hypothetical protein